MELQLTGKMVIVTGGSAGIGPHEVLVPGTFYRAEITESHDYDVVARVLE
jgi:hypothetical protein